MTHLIMRPLGNGRYRAVRSDGLICVESRTPFFDAARFLLKIGTPPDTELTCSHLGSDTVAMRSTVGEAAKWTIQESGGRTRRAPWKPYAGPRAGDPEDG